MGQNQTTRDRRFKFLVPFTRVPFCVPIFDPHLNKDTPETQLRRGVSLAWGASLGAQGSDAGCAAAERRAAQFRSSGRAQMEGELNFLRLYPPTSEHGSAQTPVERLLSCWKRLLVSVLVLPADKLSKTGHTQKYVA